MPLDLKVFEDQMRDLKALYKPWDYPLAREKKILEIVRNLDDAKFKQIIADLTASEKAPVPEDFARAVQAIKRADAPKRYEKPPRKNDCPECFETGLKLVSEKDEQATVLIRCGCGFGTALAHMYKLPQWTAKLAEYYEVKEFPASFFVPSEDKTATKETVLHRWHYWFERVRISEKFWDQSNTRGA